MKSVSGRVIVITGASSGIGKATALRLGAMDAQLVLAARNRDALEEVAATVKLQGGREPLVRALDVSHWDEVNALALATVESFGRVDIWINNAGVLELAFFEQMDVPEIDRLVAVNLLGQMYGVKAVLPTMRTQGFGTIINVGSVASERALPLQSVYSAAKHGVKGFTEALRVELAHEQSGIDVCLVLPGAINTPIFTLGRSKMGVQARPVPPVYDTDVAARALVHACLHPQRELYIGASSRIMTAMERISRAGTDWFMVNRGRAVKEQLSERPIGPNNLFESPKGLQSVEGDWGDKAHSHSLYTELVGMRKPAGAIAALSLAAVGLPVLLRSRKAHRGGPTSEAGQGLHS